MVKQILWRLAGVAMVIGSVLFTPHCGGDGGYLLLTIPLGLYVTFGPKEMYE